MDFMTYQHWLLLRPLIIFLMVLGLLFVATVVGWIKSLRRTRKQNPDIEADLAVPASRWEKHADVARVERSATFAENSTPRVGAYLSAYISDRRAA
jgi:hypothetical protein